MKISTAYDAYWFLHEHPKMLCLQMAMVDAKTPAKRSARSRIRLLKDECPWLKSERYKVREFTHLERHAVDCNLDIFYARVNKRGRVDDDETENVFIECWLEFGPIKFAVTDGVLRLQNQHDIDLDCGAPTFDQALVKLARRVKRKYGDFPAPQWLTKEAA